MKREDREAVQHDLNRNELSSIYSPKVHDSEQEYSRIKPRDELIPQKPAPTEVRQKMKS